MVHLQPAEHPSHSPPDTLERFRAGESQATVEVRSWVQAVVRRGNWRFEDPEGLTQEVLLELLRILLERPQTHWSSPRAFVRSVAQCTCIDAYRRQRLRERVVDDEADSRSLLFADPHSRDAGLERDQRQLLAYVFQRLPEACRQLCRWVYAEGRSAAEVGGLLGIRPGTARVRVHRCLKKARQAADDFAQRRAPGGTP